LRLLGKCIITERKLRKQKKEGQRQEVSGIGQSTTNTVAAKNRNLPTSTSLMEKLQIDPNPVRER